MKIFKIITIIGALFLSAVLIKNIESITNVRSRVDNAQKEVENLQKEQNELKNRIRTATSEAFVEEVARNKLGLGKAGETVIVLPSDDFLKSLAPSLESGDIEPEKANWRKWLGRFFDGGG